MTFTPLRRAKSRVSSRRLEPRTTSPRLAAMVAPIAAMLLTAGSSHAADGWPPGRLIDAGPVHHVAPEVQTDAGQSPRREIEAAEPRRPASPPSVSSCSFRPLGANPARDPGAVLLLLLGLGQHCRRRRGDAPRKYAWRS